VTYGGMSYSSKFNETNILLVSVRENRGLLSTVIKVRNSSGNSYPVGKVFLNA